MAAPTVIHLKSPGTLHLEAPGNEPWHVELDDPALSVMTDFNERRMVSVGRHVQIDRALESMKHAGVRASFVTDEGEREVVGLVTAYDIMGEKPLRYALGAGIGHHEVNVENVMEPVSAWLVADYAEIKRASVGDVLKTLQNTGRSHLPVIETAGGRLPRLRGVFSAAKILRLTAHDRPGEDV